MGSKLLNSMKHDDNYTLTENGGITHKTTESNLLDMFAMGGAMRERPAEDVILMFKQAYQEDPEMAMKLLFYLRDVRGGQGERRFFRTCLNWCARNEKYRASIRKNIENIPLFGRWDDLYALVDTPLEVDVMNFIKKQLALDIKSTTPSLLAKWLKSENASNKETIRYGTITRQWLGMTHREYRKVLAALRERIKVLERLMTENRWDEIEFDKIPSRAGLIYKNAFARNDITKARYEAFARNEKTTVNADVLYPYDVVHEAIKLMKSYNWHGADIELDDTNRLMVNKYWDNLADYFENASLDALCMVDNSGSMEGRPMEVAIALGLYCAERNHGPWYDHYISFASQPQLIETEGVDFCDKVDRIVRTCLCDNTNIEAAFDLILNTAINHHLSWKDMPEYLIIISDMEFDMATYGYGKNLVNKNNIETVMDTIATKFERNGFDMPKLIFWNVDARQNNIPMIGGNVSYVSGFSPTIFKCIMTGKTGWDLMMEVINTKRYACIHA